MNGDASEEQKLKDEVHRLQEELSLLRYQVNSTTNPTSLDKPTAVLPSHSLLLLSDSALPLGSFAFSSGLESYLAHHPPSHNARPTTLPTFVVLSLQSMASAALPYLLAVQRVPAHLPDLDDTFDASILCPVAKRASVAQGRALLTLWQRALKHGYSAASDASRALRDFDREMKKASVGGTPSLTVLADRAGSNVGDGGGPLHAHFPLIWAAVCAAMDLTERESAYTFLFNHAKAVVSAGVRASVLGPYAAQQLLGSQWLRAEIEQVMESNWEAAVEDAGQTAPMMDVWMGRHELLYSRIFNS